MKSSKKYLSDNDIEAFFNKNSTQKSRSFFCANCFEEVSISAPGTENRNHCPFCLSSKHVDEKVGDRKAKCGGTMMAIGKFLRPNGEEVIIHKCIDCGKFSNNRVAGDDDLGLVSDLTIIEESDKQDL